jgi:hypothetical protein
MKIVLVLDILPIPTVSIALFHQRSRGLSNAHHNTDFLAIYPIGKLRRHMGIDEEISLRCFLAFEGRQVHYLPLPLSKIPPSLWWGRERVGVRPKPKVTPWPVALTKGSP